MNLSIAAKGFAAAGAEPRLSVLRCLVKAGAEGMTVGALQRSLDIPASTLAHHLRHLSDAELIHQTKNGREVLSVAEFKKIENLAQFLISECCVHGTKSRDCS